MRFDELRVNTPRSSCSRPLPCAPRAREWNPRARRGALRPGWTLAQLLAVCAALGMGIVVLVPFLRGQIERGRSVRCKDNLSRIARGLRLYHFDHEAWPENRVVTQAGLIKDQNVWIELVAGNKYVAQAVTFTCPSDPNAVTPASNIPLYNRREVAHMPSYGLNQLTWLEYGVNPADDPGTLRQASRPEQTILLADRGPDFGRDALPDDPEQRREELQAARDAGRLPADDGFRMGMVRPPPVWLVRRHAGALNLIALAGSVTTSQGDPAPLPLRRYYDDCATGDCTFCNVFKAAHYDFSAVGLHWWTGPYYSPPAAPTGDPGDDQDPN